MGRSGTHPAVGVVEETKTGQRIRAANPINGSKGGTIAVVVGCAIAVAPTAVHPSIALSIPDSCQIAGPIQKLKSAVQSQRYCVEQLQLLDEEVRYPEARPERLTVEVGHQKSSPIVSDHKSMPIAGRWFPALGIRHKSRDSSYPSCFT